MRLALDSQEEGSMKAMKSALLGVAMLWSGGAAQAQNEQFIPMAVWSARTRGGSGIYGALSTTNMTGLRATA